jgi:Spy/CpxP family protein refolding chaperone
MTRRTLAIFLVGIFILGAVTVAFAKRGGHHGRGGFGFLPGLRFDHLQARLKLTPEQTSKVQEIVRTEKMKAMEQFGAAGEERRALAKEIFTDNPSSAEIQRRVQAMQQQHAQMLNQIVAAGLEVNKVFTPEQRAEIHQILDEHAQVAAKRRERMRQRMTSPPTSEQK